MVSSGAAERITRDQITVMLMGLYQLAHAEVEQAVRPLVFSEGVFATVNELIDDNRLGRFAPIAAQRAGVRQSIGDVVGAAERLYQRVTARPEMIKQLGPYYELIAAATALAGPVVTSGPLTLKLDPIRHLPHLQRVYIAGKDGEPDVVLAGAPGDIDIPGAHPVLQRMRIRHREDRFYPTLLLAHLSKSEQEPWPLGRRERLQKPGPRFDLSLFSYSGLPLAYVRTHRIETKEPTLEFIGKRVCLKLTVRSGDYLLATSISDLEGRERAGDHVGRELAHCLRLIPASA